MAFFFLFILFLLYVQVLFALVVHFLGNTTCPFSCMTSSERLGNMFARLYGENVDFRASPWAWGKKKSVPRQPWQGAISAKS